MKKLHVTIGLSVYNEEANIGRLIELLRQQATDSFILDRILVQSDGSTDKTVSIVQSLAKKYKNITCVPDPIRRGVTYRTNQLMKRSASDILVLFDGDTLPENRQTLRHLISPFNNASVALTTANLIPLPPVTAFEHNLYAWRAVWSAITHAWNRGNNIYNFRGAGLAIRRQFAKSVHIPQEITGASSHVLYLAAKAQSKNTVFCNKATIRYRLATTSRDYSLQINRGNSDSALLRKLFPDLFTREYTIPTSIRLYTMLRCMIYTPMSTIIGLAFHALTPLVFQNTRPSDHNGIWEIAKSTKTLTKTQAFIHI